MPLLKKKKKLKPRAIAQQEGGIKEGFIHGSIPLRGKERGFARITQAVGRALAPIIWRKAKREALEEHGKAIENVWGTDEYNKFAGKWGVTHDDVHLMGERARRLIHWKTLVERHEELWGEVKTSKSKASDALRLVAEKGVDIDKLEEKIVELEGKIQVLEQKRVEEAPVVKEEKPLKGWPLPEEELEEKEPLRELQPITDDDGLSSGAVPRKTQKAKRQKSGERGVPESMILEVVRGKDVSPRPDDTLLRDKHTYDLVPKKKIKQLKSGKA
ncbi:hypothetical protein ACFLQ2_00925 [archaeon]